MANGVRATPFKWVDPSAIPKRQFLYGRHYIRRFMTTTFGAGGSGKTAQAVVEALSMVTGRILLGDAPDTPLRVWLVNCEDPLEELQRRVAAAAIHYNLDPAALEERLFLDSGRDQDFVVLHEDGRQTRIVEPVVSSLIEQIHERSIDALIVDPFVSTHTVGENDNGKIQQAASQWVRVADATNAAVELIHHVRKAQERGEITADDGRGAGSLKDKARSVRVINAMSKPEAESAGIAPEDRFDYFRIGGGTGKSNMSRQGGPGQWRKMVSVALGNGVGQLDRGDEVGVVTEWRWPEQSAMPDIDPEVEAAIMERLAGGEYRENSRSPDWAGMVVMEELGLDPRDKSARRRASRILNAWKDVKVKAVEKFDKTRHLREFIVPIGGPCVSASVTDAGD
nr:AAA family ATPase [Chelatococcus sp. YT9]